MSDYFVFYRSFDECLSVLSDEKKSFYLHSIIEYGLNGKEPELKGIELALWLMFKKDIDAQYTRAEKKKEQNKKYYEKKLKIICPHCGAVMGKDEKKCVCGFNLELAEDKEILNLMESKKEKLTKTFFLNIDTTEKANILKELQRL